MQSNGCDFKQTTGFHPEKVYMLGEKHSGLKPRGNLQNFTLLKQYCVDRKILFEDLQFEPGMVRLGTRWKRMNVEWLRPHEIASNPKFVSEGMDRFDVNQGELGDCWFLAALANITTNHRLLEFIVPVDQSFRSNYAGIFHFRFWQYGRWIDVVIDDRLPTYEGKPIYSRSKQPDEFWTSLLEKAYAKLYGSYENIEGGLVSEALEDLTGGLNEIYLEIGKKSDEFNFFDMMMMSATKRSYMGCGIVGTGEIESRRDNGLYADHAYSVTGITLTRCRLGNSYKLVRIRNPWGKCEWNGRWSDSSEAWSLLPEDAKQQLLVKKNDGEFWMEFDEFVKSYTLLEICHPDPNLFQHMQDELNRWKSFMTDGAWIAKISNGGVPGKTYFYKNPQYALRVKGQRKFGSYKVVVGLMQKNRRLDCLPPQSIGFVIYNLSTQPKYGRLGGDFFLAKHPEYRRRDENMKQVTGHVSLANGTYCIIPYTLDVQQNCEFLLRVYCEADFTVTELDENVQVEDGNFKIVEEASDSTNADNAVREVFRTYAGKDEMVDWKELKEILDLLLKPDKLTVSKEVCRSMLALADSDLSGKLNFHEFFSLWERIGVWRGIFRNHDSDLSNSMSVGELKEALNAAHIKVNNKILKMLAIRFGNENGEMDVEDFIHCCVKLESMISIYQRKCERREDTDDLEKWLISTIYS